MHAALGCLAVLALLGLGGHATPIGQAAWHVLGWGLTVKEFAARTQLGGGRALDEKTARGLVVGACGVLAGWYERADAPRRRRDPHQQRRHLRSQRDHLGVPARGLA